MTPRRSERLPRALHLAALSGLSVAQPLYDLIGRHATFLVAHGAGPATVLAFTAILSLGIPLALTLIVEAVSLVSPAAGRRLQHALVALLGGALAAVVLRTQPAILAVAGIVAAAAVLGIAYRRKGVRTFLTILSPAALVFPVLFLTATPAARVMWPRQAAGEAGEFLTLPPIVLVVFDEMSTFDLLSADGQIDAARFPNMAALAEASTWFPNAAAADPFTPRAVPAIVTGRLPAPDDNRLPFAADHPDNLFTWLGSSYELHVEEPMTGLCPRRLCPEARTLDAAAFARDVAVVYLHLLVPAELAEGRLPSLAFAWAGFGAEEAQEDAPGWSVQQAFADALERTRPGRFREAIATIRGPSRPVLHFVHSLLPHDPYVFRADGTTYTVPAITDGLTLEGRWLDDPWVVREARARHIEQARAADMLLGELVDKLRAEGLFDDALVIVTADHGGAFVPGDLHRWPTPASYKEISAVPLIVKRPHHSSGGVDPRPVLSSDIAPTIADVLGAELHWPHDGTSVFAEFFPTRHAIAYEKYGLEAQPRIDVRDAARRAAAAFAPDLAYQALIGQQVAELAPAGSTGLRIFSSVLEAFSAAGPGAAVPSFVRGRVEGGRTEPMVLALALDGAIQAVTRTYMWDRAPHHFAVLLPQPPQGQHPHRLEIFAVRGDAGAWRLEPISSDLTARLRLEGVGEAERLVTTGGSTLPIQGTATGQIDRVELTADAVAFHGWAVAPEHAAARSIVVIANGESIAATSPADARPDVATALGIPAATATTFAVSVPRAAAQSPLRLFAIGERSAAPITIPAHVEAELAKLRQLQ